MSQAFLRLSDKPGGPGPAEKQGHLRSPHTLPSVGGFTAHLQGGLGGWMDGQMAFPLLLLTCLPTHCLRTFCFDLYTQTIPKNRFFFQNLQLHFTSWVIFFFALGAAFEVNPSRPWTPLLCGKGLKWRGVVFAGLPWLPSSPQSFHL